jgi:SSS family solute:Na+ symporter
MPAFNLNPLDLTIVGLYIIGIVLLGMRFGKGQETAEEYFLAGRTMIWPYIGFSLFAANISSTTLVGLAGDAYSTGISVFNYEWMAAVVLVFFVLFFLPFILRAKVYTMPEFLEKRFDARARAYFSALTLFLNIVVDTAGSLYAGALMFKLVFPDIPMWQTITVMALLTGAYTIYGGLSAVIYTDVVQAVLLLIGSIIVTVIAYFKIGSWDAVTAKVPPDMLSLIRPLDDPAVPWLGLITGVFLLGFYFWCTNQFMVQRVLAAKDVNHGRWGSLFAGFLKLPVLFIMVLPGTMAIILYPNLPKADLVFPTLLFDLLPTGVLGFVVAGFLAAIMSSISCTLNSASTLVTMDFIHKLRPQVDSRQLMKIGRWVTFTFMILSAAWAPQIENFASLFKYLQKVLSYAVPPVVVLFLAGTFWKRANAQGAFATLVAGVASGLLFFLANEIFGWTNIHFLYIAPILFIISAVTLAIVSLITPAPDGKKVRDYIWTKDFYHAETRDLANVPWYQNYRNMSLALMIVTIVLVGLFW